MRKVSNYAFYHIINCNELGEWKRAVPAM